MFGFLSGIGKTVSDGANAVVDAVTDGVNETVDGVTDGVNAAVDTAKGVASAVGEIGANAAKATGAALSDASDAVSDVFSDRPDDITEVPGYLAGVWGDFWEFETDSINAIGGLLLDEAEYFADAEELPDWIRDICKGLIGSGDGFSLGGVIGATLGGLGKCASDLGKGGSQLLGNPVEIAQNFGEGAKYVWQHWREIPSKIPSEISNWWNDKTTYEKVTTVVEVYAMWRVFASGGAEGESVTLESEAAGVTGEAGEAAEIAAEAGEAGGIAGSEGVAAVEGSAEEAAGAIDGVAGEASEAIEGAAGKGKIRIESAGESGSGSNTGVGNPVKVEGRGSTGRTIPNNLEEQMAMHQVQSNPLEGASELPIKLNDTRWKSSDGWVKMQSVVRTADGNKITIHYVYNKVTGAFDDFKFK